MIASPMMNATTGLSWWGVLGVVSPPSCLLRRSAASEANRLVDIRGMRVREQKWGLFRRRSKAMPSRRRHRTDLILENRLCDVG